MPSTEVGRPARRRGEPGRSCRSRPCPAPRTPDTGLGEAELAAAIQRLLDYYLRTADAADDHLRALPGQRKSVSVTIVGDTNRERGHRAAKISRMHQRPVPPMARPREPERPAPVKGASRPSAVP
jgi:hypothetical protein